MLPDLNQQKNHLNKQMVFFIMQIYFLENEANSQLA